MDKSEQAGPVEFGMNRGKEGVVEMSDHRIALRLRDPGLGEGGKLGGC